MVNLDGRATSRHEPQARTVRHVVTKTEVDAPVAVEDAVVVDIADDVRTPSHATARWVAEYTLRGTFMLLTIAGLVMIGWSLAER